MPRKAALVVLGVVSVLVTVAATFAVVAPRSAGSPYGELAIAVHDAPCSNCTHVWVTFESVSVHASNGSGRGWFTLNVSGTTLDLLALNGTALARVLGVESLPVGQYEQVRIAVSGVSVTLPDGLNLTARIPAVSSANVNGAFSTSSGANTTISIDVDLASSLHVVSNHQGLSATFTPNLGSVVVVPP